MTESYGLNIGLMQGDSLSTALLNIVLESAIRESGIQIEKPIRTISYANDNVEIMETQYKNSLKQRQRA